MKSVVKFLGQPLDRLRLLAWSDVRVSLQHSELRPAAQFLDGSQVHPGCNQPRCEGMAERVRGNPDKTSPLAGRFERVSNGIIRHSVGFYKHMVTSLLLVKPGERLPNDGIQRNRAGLSVLGIGCLDGEKGDTNRGWVSDPSV